MNKPKLSAEQLVAKMKNEKGITFEHMGEEDAVNFLKRKNNYYRLAAYRKNYDKRLNGENRGTYIGLDFAYLVDLSIIDMHLRNMIIQMCLDIEHDLKVQLLNDITANPEEDGYNIVASFIGNNEFLKEEIYKKRFSTYDNIVSDSIKQHRYTELSSLINERMAKHSDYYSNQQLLSSAYDFVKKITDFLLK